MDVNKNDTAVLVTDPQNDFLSEQGVTWQLVGDSVTENRTIENIEQIMRTAKDNGFQVFISPHYYFPTDHSWQFGGTVENLMHEIKMFDRNGALTLEGFSGSGADWLERYKPIIDDGKTVVVSNQHRRVVLVDVHVFSPFFFRIRFTVSSLTSEAQAERHWFPPSFGLKSKGPLSLSVLSDPPVARGRIARVTSSVTNHRVQSFGIADCTYPNL